MRFLLLSVRLLCLPAAAQQDDADQAEITASTAAADENVIGADGASGAGAGVTSGDFSRALPSGRALAAAAAGSGGGSLAAAAKVLDEAGACLPRPGHPPAMDNGNRIAAVAMTGLGPSRSVASRAVLLAGNYLYVSGEPGLQTVNVTNPEAPVVTDDWTKSSAKMNGAAAKGKVLYVTDWYPPTGLELFDLSNPARPAHIATVATPDYAWDAVVHGNYLDLSLGSETKCGVATYDISDPRSPQLLYDIQIPDRLCGRPSRYGDYLYFTHKSSLYVYDDSDVGAPKRVQDMPFDGNCGQTAVTGDVLYMLCSQNGSPGIHVLSLADPSSPQEVTFLPVPAWSFSLQGDRLVIPANGNGVFTADISDPEDPKILSQWSTDWPGLNHHGYPVASAGRGRYAYIGTTGGGTCNAGRVYSVKIK